MNGNCVKSKGHILFRILPSTPPVTCTLCFKYQECTLYNTFFIKGSVWKHNSTREFDLCSSQLFTLIEGRHTEN